MLNGLESPMFGATNGSRDKVWVEAERSRDGRDAILTLADVSLRRKMAQENNGRHNATLQMSRLESLGFPMQLVADLERGRPVRFRMNTSAFSDLVHPASSSELSGSSGLAADIEWRGLRARVWFDDRDPKNRGWYAEYLDAEGVFSDSEKIWSGERMPTRRDAEQRARHMALQALKVEARRRGARPLTLTSDLTIAAHRYATDEEDIDLQDAAVIQDAPPLGSRTAASFAGKHIGVFSSEDEAIAALQRLAEKDNYYPGLYYIDDHGGINPRPWPPADGLPGSRLRLVAKASRGVDLSVMPIDVGFDLRLQQMVIAVPPSVTSVRFETQDGLPRERQGLTARQIVDVLRRHGYKARVGV